PGWRPRESSGPWPSARRKRNRLRPPGPRPGTKRRPRCASILLSFLDPPLQVELLGFGVALVADDDVPADLVVEGSALLQGHERGLGVGQLVVLPDLLDHPGYQAEVDGLQRRDAGVQV